MCTRWSRAPFLLILFLFLVFTIQSCRSSSLNKRGKIIVLQSMGDFPADLAQEVYREINRIDTQTILRKPIPAPAAAYYASRKRYRADSIIRILRDKVGTDTIMVGLVSFDISTTKNGIKDWGVMGLGYRPGKACVISTFRLQQAKLKEQFFKVVLHEIGHTQGLPHCPIKNCLMRDAKGGNHLDEEIAFCKNCKKYLMGKGVNLN